jgi:predicted nucleic acid-binding protein
MMTKIYFDTSVYVKHFKDEDGSDSVERIIQIAEKNNLLKIFMSFWTINESVTAIDKNYYQKKLVSSEERDKIIATILTSSIKYLQTYPNIVFVPVTSNIVRDSIHLIRLLHISADDALHVHTATKRRCKYFIFHDRHLKNRVPNNIQGMTMIDITNLNSVKRLFGDIKKYESFTSEEWKNKSIKGEVCAVPMCSNSPKNRCPKCFVHYCYNHIKNHYHTMPDNEIERHNEEKESLR